MSSQNPIDILNIRLASGEIAESDYERIRAIIDRSLKQETPAKDVNPQPDYLGVKPNAPQPEPLPLNNPPSDIPSKNGYETANSEIPKSLTPRERRKNSALARFWRGEIPLVKSYWLWMFCGNLVLMIPINLVHHFPIDLNLLLVFYLVVCGWTVFQCIGLWRSATIYKAQRPARKFWGILVQILIIIGLPLAFAGCVFSMAIILQAIQKTGQV